MVIFKGSFKETLIVVSISYSLGLAFCPTWQALFLIGVLRPFAFNVIVDMARFEISAIRFLYFGLICFLFSFLFFTCFVLTEFCL